MTDSSFTMTDTIFTQAVAKHDTPEWDTFVGAIQVVTGADKDTFEAAFNAKLKIEARKVAITKVATQAEGFKATKSLLKIAKAASEADTVLTLVYDKETDSAKLVVGRARTKRNDTGEVSANSRISAFVAYQRGKKAGDTFEIVKADGGYQDVQAEVMIQGRKNGGLAGYVLRNYPGSDTAKVLAKYGYTLD